MSSRPISAQPQRAAAPIDWPFAEKSVRNLIAEGKDKTALERAKDLHKAFHNSESESLLIDAYVARVESLTRHNLSTEANALLSMVAERFPHTAPRLEEHIVTAAVRAGSLDKLLAALADQNLNPERRALLERIVEQHVLDLNAVAESPLLAEGHSLRESAGALHQAFAAATSGPVSEDVLAVQVSYRSPLAPWKMLVRAIASFHANDDETCRRSLEAIKPGSAPARLVPVLRHMLGDSAGQAPSGPASELVRQVTHGRAALREALGKLEDALHSKNRQRILDSVRAAVGECRISAPSMCERLKQYIVVRHATLDPELKITTAQVAAAMGSPVRAEASFMRMHALALESVSDAYMAVTACVVWDAFRSAAVQEGWFPERGLEVATLYLHMAEVVRALPPDFARETRAQDRIRPSLGDASYILDVDELYRRACALDPHSEAFAQWLSWAQEAPPFEPGRTDPEQVARAWHKAVPKDIKPLLFLIAKKEATDAYHTAVEFLSKAEAIDSLHSEVRNARYRLTIGKACSQIKRKKANEAEETLRAIAGLPQAGEGDRPAVLTAMRCVIRTFLGDRMGAESLRTEAEQTMGNRSAASLLINALALQCKLGKNSPPVYLRIADRATFVQGVARACVLLSELKLPVTLPYPFIDALRELLPRSAPSLTVEQLLALGDLASSEDDSRLLYEISTAGLQRGDEFAQHFLLIRADALLDEDDFRSEICAGAAASFARERCDQALLDRIAAFYDDALGIDLPNPKPGDAVEILAKERAAHSFPRRAGNGPDYDRFRKRQCDCPECRRARGEFAGVDEIDDDAEGIFDVRERARMERDLAGCLPPGFPPEFAAEMLDAIARGQSPEAFFERMNARYDLPPPPGARNKKKGKRK